MKTSQLFKILVMLVVSSLVAGCKLEVVAVQGGDVGWSGGSCKEGSNCVIEITQKKFSNTFTVTPKPGFEFVKWQKGANFLCGDSTSLTCTLTMPDDDNLAAAVLGVFATAYIMPVYKDIGLDPDGDSLRNELDDDDDGDGVLDIKDLCADTPLGKDVDGTGCPFMIDSDYDGVPDDTDNCPDMPNYDQVDGDADGVGTACDDIVTRNGIDWLQPRLFVSLTWSDINAVCPAGECIAGGVLNGQDMTGWTWADAQSVLDLLNGFCPSGVTSCNRRDAAWVLPLHDNFWVVSSLTSYPDRIFWNGFTRLIRINAAGTGQDVSVVGAVAYPISGDSNVDTVYSDWRPNPYATLPPRPGAWFYR